jgi:aminopeptidase YwaD
LLQQAEQAGVPLGLFRPLQVNSDHANFAQAGIPAFRLVAGFNDPGAATRFLLTPEDRRDKVAFDELMTAARFAKALTRKALDAAPTEASLWRR